MNIHAISYKLINKWRDPTVNFQGISKQLHSQSISDNCLRRIKGNDLKESSFEIVHDKSEHIILTEFTINI